MPITRKLKFAIVLYLAAGVCLHLVLFWMARRQVEEGYPDFKIFYTAARMLRRGERGQLYDRQLQLRTQTEFAPVAAAKEGLLPYNHPPFEALLYMPFAYLNFLSAYWLWLGISLLFVLGILRIMRRFLPAIGRDGPWLLYLAALGFFPLFYSLMQAQDSVLLLAIYCFVFSALAEGKEFRAGAILALGLFKFHLVLPFAFVLFLRRRWLALAGFAITAIGEGLVSVALVGWKEFLYYPHFVWWINQHQTVPVIVPRNMPNLRGLLAGWRGQMAAPTWMNAIILVISLTALVWVSWRWDVSGLPRDSRWRAGFSLCVLVTFLTGYHGYNQDMTILFLPVMLMADQVIAGKIGKIRISWTVRLCLVLMFCTPLYLILTLHFQHENLFALVLMALAWSVAKSGTQWRSVPDSGLPV